MLKALEFVHTSLVVISLTWFMVEWRRQMQEPVWKMYLAAGVTFLLGWTANWLWWSW